MPRSGWCVRQSDDQIIGSDADQVFERDLESRDCKVMNHTNLNKVILVQTKGAPGRSALSKCRSAKPSQIDLTPALIGDVRSRVRNATLP